VEAAGTPETASVERDVVQHLKAGAATKQLKHNLDRKSSPNTISIRYVNSGMSIKTPLVTKKPLFSWLRCAELPDDPVLHRAVAAFATDFTLAMSPLAPHGIPNRSLTMLVSLDHTIYFHSDFRVDADWFLYEVQSSWAGANRGLCNGKVYTRDGRLAMTVQQETLVRMKKGYRSVAKL
jgi:acyl-CoA thioesterase II